MMQTFLPFFLISFSYLLFGCDSFSNRHEKTVLECGRNYKVGAQYFTVVGPDLNRLSGDAIEVKALYGANPNAAPISSKGCIEEPESGQYLIKAKNRDWGIIVSFPRSRNAAFVALQDYSGQSATLQCSDLLPWTISREFSLKNLIVSTFEPNLEPGFELNYELIRDGQTVSQAGSLNLRLAMESQPFFDKEEGDYDVVLTTTDSLHASKRSTKACKFRLDQSPPLVQVAVNSQSNFKTIATHRTSSIAILDPNSSMSFNSKDNDVLEIKYCLIELDDDFNDSQHTKLQNWLKAAASKDCDESSLQSIAVRTPLAFSKRSGIWSLRYTAVDGLGNLSAPQSQLFIHISDDRLNLIKSQSLSDVSLYKLQNQSLLAATAALQAESSRLQLATKFERDRIAGATLAGLINGLNQPGIIKKFDSSDRRANHVAFVQKDRVIAAASIYDAFIEFWDTSTRKNLFRLELPESDATTALVATPDERFLVVGTEHGLIQLIDSSSYKLIRSIQAHDESVTAFTFNAEGTFLVSGSADGTIKSWKFEDLTLDQTFLGHSNSITALVLTPDNAKLVAGSKDASVIIWDFSTAAQMQTLQPQVSAIQALAISHNGKRLAIGFNFALTVQIWDVSQLMASKKWEFESVGDDISSFNFSSDDSTLAVASSSQVIQFWDMTWGFEKKEKRLTDPGTIISTMIFSRDHTKVVIGSLNRSFGLWEVQTGYAPQKIIAEDQAKTLAIAISPDNSIRATAESFSPTVNLFGPTGYIQLNGSADALTLLFTQDGQKLVVGTGMGTLEIWNLGQRDAPRVWEGHTAAVQALTMNSEQNTLLSGTSDGSLIARDIASGTIIFKTQLASPVVALSWNGGDHFVSAQKNGQIDVWSTQTFTSIQVLHDPMAQLTSIDISEDGTRLVTGSANGIVRFWNIDTGESRFEPSLFAQTITQVKWLPQSEAALSGSFDQTLRIWDYETGKNMSTWPGNLSGIGSFAVSKDGSQITTGPSYQRGPINTWNISHGYLTEKLCAVANVSDFRACQ